MAKRFVCEECKRVGIDTDDEVEYMYKCKVCGKRVCEDHYSPVVTVIDEFINVSAEGLKGCPWGSLCLKCSKQYDLVLCRDTTGKVKSINIVDIHTKNIEQTISTEHFKLDW